MSQPNKKIIELELATEAEIAAGAFVPVFIPSSPGATTGTTKRVKQNGMILVSPNGTKWRITIDNAGTIVRTAI